MTAMTDYLENSLKAWFEKTSFPSPPTDFYVALYTTATSDAGGGTEVAGGSYARQIVTFTANTNDDLVLFVDLPACTITHAAILDSITGGTMLMHGPLTASKTVSLGDALAFIAGSIDLVFS